MDHPFYLMSNIILSTLICREKKLIPLALVKSKKNKKTKKICQSYGVKNFYFLDEEQFKIKLRIRSFYYSLKIFSRIKTASDLLKCQYKGVSVGDLIYDTYLRRFNKKTVSKLNFEIFKLIFNTIINKEVFEAFFKGNPFICIDIGLALWSETR